MGFVVSALQERVVFARGKNTRDRYVPLRQPRVSSSSKSLQRVRDGGNVLDAEFLWRRMGDAKEWPASEFVNLRIAAINVMH